MTPNRLHPAGSSYRAQRHARVKALRTRRTLRRLGAGMVMFGIVVTGGLTLAWVHGGGQWVGQAGPSLTTLDRLDAPATVPMDEALTPEAVPVLELRQAPPVTAAANKGPTFNGRPIRPVKTMRMLTTAYSPDERSCGIWADGVTASGQSVWTNGGNLVAADTSLLPFGTLVTIPGYNDGEPVQVLDRGGAIKGHRLDLLYPTHDVALQWGAQRLDVVVWEYADE